VVQPDEEVELEIIGNLDSASAEGIVEGWCWSPDAPEIPRTVAVLIDGIEAATALCTRPRADLAQAGFGSGAHAFHATVPPTSRTSGATVMVTLREIETGESVGGPLMVTWSHAAPAPVHVTPTLPPEGNVDGISRDGRISGWCWYPDAPELAARVAVTVDGAVAGTVLASLFRQDLREAGIGTGAYGFSFALPWQVMSTTGVLTIAAHDEATGMALGTPQTLRLGLMARAEDRLAEIERQIRALRHQIEAQEARPATDRCESLAALLQSLTGDAVDAARLTVIANRPGEALGEAIAMLRRRHRPFALDIPDQPRATIAVPAGDSLATLYRCLHALHVSGADRTADIMVIESGVVAEIALLPGIVGNLRMLRGADLAAGLNSLAQGADTELLVVLAPDLHPLPGWLDTLSGSFDRTPQAALVGCPVIGQDGLPRQTGLDLVAGVGSLAFAVRRTALLAAGGFDTAYASQGHAMLDLCLRLRQAGHLVRSQPDTAVICADSFDPCPFVPDLRDASEDSLRLRHRFGHEKI
jgi:hypothetical protein